MNLTSSAYSSSTKSEDPSFASYPPTSIAGAVSKTDERKSLDSALVNSHQVYFPADI